jgi:hypothetical protein
MIRVPTERKNLIQISDLSFNFLCSKRLHTNARELLCTLSDFSLYDNCTEINSETFLSLSIICVGNYFRENKMV